MNLLLEFKDITVLVNVVVRIITAVVFGFFLIPLYFKEATVKNGLRILRLELLATGLIIFFMNIIGLFIIIFRFFGQEIQFITDITTYFNTFGFLVYALIKLRVYTQKYSPENKKLHIKFDKIEAQAMDKQKRKQEKRKKGV